MSTNSNITSFFIGAGTTLKVSERPNAVGTLHGRAGFWFNASFQCDSPSGFSSFGDLKLYVDTADRAAAESKVRSIQGHIAQGHKVYVEIAGGMGTAAGWPVSGIKHWATKDEGGQVQSWGTDFMVNLPVEALRFFAKGILRRDEAAAPAREARPAQAPAVAEAAAPVETAVVTAEAPAAKKRGMRKQRAAGQPVLIVA